MDENSDQILNHIESQRSQLGRNLDELEHKVKRTADWRSHFDDNPTLMLGLALGGGLLVGSLVGGGSSKPRYRYRAGSKSTNWSATQSRSGYEGDSSLSSASMLAGESSTGSASLDHDHHDENSATSQQRRRAVEALDHIKAALIAFGIAKSKEFLAQALPGFQEHLDRTSGATQTNEDWNARSRAENPADVESHFGRDRQTVGVGSESQYARNPSDLSV